MRTRVRHQLASTLAVGLALAIGGVVLPVLTPAGATPGEATEHADAEHGIAGHGTVLDALAGDEDPAAGVVFDGLEVAGPGSMCEGMFEIVVDDVVACTVGPTRAPAGVDVRRPVRTSDLAAKDAGTAGYAAFDPADVPCVGDGVDGARIHVLYVRASDRPDRFAAAHNQILGWMVNTATDFDTSAMAHAGQHRFPRFVTTAHSGDTCELVVENVVVPSWGDDSMADTIEAVYDRGYDDLDRKYLMYTDANLYCGIGQVFRDDEPTPHNINNGNDFSPMYARIDVGCWDDPVVATHELLHTLGAVQTSAPNATPFGHCSDEWDIMCYPDGSGVPMRTVCPDDPARPDLFLDCNGDDYFDPTPTANSWLAGHWNTANSRFLSTATGPDVAAVARPASRSAAERFIRAAYEDFLDRFATTSEVNAYVNKVNTTSQRQAFLRDLAYTDAYVGTVVTRFYRDTLDRDPDPVGRKNWVDHIISGRKTTGRVAAEFYASDEYFRNLGGGTNESWVRDLYRKLLFREPDPQGFNNWVNIARTRGRVAVSDPFYRATETLGVRVDLLYLKFLGRLADSSGKRTWTETIRRSGNDVDLAVTLASSTEYFNRAQYR